MIIYSSSQVMSNTLPQKNINLPTTVKSIQFRNVSAWSFHIVSSNSEWDILPFSSTIFPVSGNQNLSIIPLTQITFTDINIPLGVSLDYMSQPVASMSSYSLLPIFTGNVNATIQNTTIDTNSTILNEQISVGLPLAGYGSISIPASGIAPVPYANTATITPDGTGLLNLGMFQFSMVSANSYPYQVTIQPRLVLNGESIPLTAGIVFNLSSSSNFGYGTTQYMIRENLGAVYQANALSVSFLQTYSSTTQEADTITFYWAVDGSSSPDISTVSTPESVQIGMTNSSGNGELISPTYPFPVYQNDYAQGMAVFGYGVLPTSVAYTTTGTDVSCIEGIFATFANTTSSRQPVYLAIQNNNDTSQVYTIVVQIPPSGGASLNWTFPHPWAPFGVSSGVSLNFGWSQANADAVHGGAYAQLSNGLA